ncbi:MAG: hypothetical protein BWX98_02310 [Candidatus Aminicenantes bacterium ADurb.Bin147]|nr:MAG: hypothetical protein BWX98_02310 [Candidatus Aminicenantes bacterium ADurb.Bin147]
MDVSGRVVSQLFQVDVFKHIQGLEQDRPLDPGVELIDLQPLVSRLDGFLEVNAPAGQVVLSEQGALLVGSADEFPSDVALVETVIGGVDRLLAAPARGPGVLFGLDKLAERFEEVVLAEDLARNRPFPVPAGVRQHHRPGVRPGLDLVLLPLDRVGRAFFHGIALGQAHGRGKHLLQTHRPELGQHCHQPAGSTGRDGRERSGRRRMAHPTIPEVRGHSPRRSRPEGIDGDDLFLNRMVDQGLRFAAPTEDVPHRADGPEHGAGRVHRVSALLEDHRPGRGGHRLAGDGRPMAAVKDRFFRFLRKKEKGRAADGNDE